MKRNRRTSRKRGNRPRGWSAGLTVSGDGAGITGHAGSAALRLLADRVGLTAALSAATARSGFAPVHDRGRVLVDAAIMLAGGGRGVRGIDALRHQQPLLGPVASPSTLSRTLAEIDSDTLDAVDRARAQVRARVWEQVIARHGRIPPARMPGGDLGATVVLRLDAHFIEAHSAKQGAARSKGRFGHHPFGEFCDNTREALAEILRPGNTGANTAADHIALVERGIIQIPVEHRGDLLITTDGAGATHEFLSHLSGLDQSTHPSDGHPSDDRDVISGQDARPSGLGRVRYSVGWPIDKRTGPAVAGLEADRWTAMLGDDGRPGSPASLSEASAPDTVGEVAELTDRLPALAGWPAGHRVFVRRLKPLPGTTPSPLPGVSEPAQPPLPGLDPGGIDPDPHGWRYEAFATTTAPHERGGHDPAWLDARHRIHARVEDRHRTGKDIGAARLPSQRLGPNAVWYRLYALATDLLAWLQLLATEGELAHAEPRTLQYRVLHAPARLSRSGRRRRLRFPPDWPWTRHIVAIFTRLQALPAPG